MVHGWRAERSSPIPALPEQPNLYPAPGRVMIAFACPHCGAQLKVDESMAGKTAPCPNCSRVVQAPAAGDSATSGQASAVRSSSRRTLRPSAAEDTAPTVPEPAPPRDYPFLAPPRGPDELGRLGPYPLPKLLATPPTP